MMSKCFFSLLFPLSEAKEDTFPEDKLSTFYLELCHLFGPCSASKGLKKDIVLYLMF